MNQICNLLFILCLSFQSLVAHAQSKVIYDSGTLIIKKLSEHAYIHISFLETEEYGKVPCNGMILVDKAEAFVLETPVDDSVSAELIEWISKDLNSKIKGVIAHHFHIDCLGGLGAFHEKDIVSYGSDMTISLAKEEGNLTPQNPISNGHRFQLGELEIISSFYGRAHTHDNIVSYFPEEELLFGGCMIKAMNSGKGNLADADSGQWPITIEKLKKAYSSVQTVVPGHGKYGGPELLDYTIELFSK